jgi:hypothetical protein
MKKFYVSAIDGSKKYLIAGPFEDHSRALAMVEPVRNRAYEINAKAWFMFWGTCSSEQQFKTPLGIFDTLD